MAEDGETRDRLSTYLSGRVAGMQILASGWETKVFEFTLAGRSPEVPEAPVATPLVLRFYEGSLADEKGRRENLTLRALTELGYPVPRPYLYEPDHAPLGAPFLIMERIAGGPLFTTKSFRSAFKTFSLGFAGFVRAQARLHRVVAAQPALQNLPPAFTPVGKPETTALLERILAIVSERVERGPLPGLRGALEDLRRAAARFGAAPAAMVHMDYHPQNVIVQGLRVNGVIDWVSADRGDRHLCSATTAVILSTTTMEQPRWMRENFAGNSLRRLFASLYIPLYHALAPMEWARFRYCQAVAALYRLSTFGMMRKRGPESVGYRPDAIQNVTPAVVRLLSRYAANKSHVPVSI